MSIDIEKLPIDDDLVDYLSLSKYLQEDTERNKNKTASEFEELGGQYLKEIENKKKKKNLKQIKLIPYILKYGEDIYDEEELMSYTLEDVQKIYDEVSSKRVSIFSKMFKFIFNIE